MRALRNVSLSLLAGMLALGTHAQAQDAPAKPLLWKIGKGEKASHVFGTIHLSGPKETKLAPAVDAAIAGSDALYCEVKMDMASQMQAAMAMMSGGEPLSKVLPKEIYARAEAEVKRINPALDLKPFENMRVWALGIMIGLLEEQLKNPGAMPLDAQLYTKAEAAGKKVGGIETIEEQLKVFGSFSQKEEIELLASTLDDIEKARREGKAPIDDLRKAYLSGDLAALENELNVWAGTLREDLKKRVMDALIVKRNHTMAERMAAKIKETPDQSIFFAVGAGHLGGPEGVLALLEKAGFAVSRVE